MNDTWFFLVVDGVVVQKQPYWEEGYIEGPDYVVPGYLYADGVWTFPPPSDEQLSYQNTSKLTTLLAQANAQVTAIQGRVDAINDAIEFGEEEPEWLIELPSRQAQLTAWKRYRVNLNKVPLQVGWAVTATFPETPEPYTDEMSRGTAKA